MMMEIGDQRSNKKVRVESSPRIHVKQEASGEEEAAGRGCALMILGCKGAEVVHED
jgi:hypothetical protein